LLGENSWGMGTDSDYNYLRAYEKTGILGKIRAKWFEDSSWVGSLP